MLDIPSKKGYISPNLIKRRGGRVAEGARLESVCILTGTEGSNPSLSAIPVLSLHIFIHFLHHLSLPILFSSIQELRKSNGCCGFSLFLLVISSCHIVY